jgi:hypothetical protein
MTKMTQSSILWPRAMELAWVWNKQNLELHFKFGHKTWIVIGKHKESQFN